ncbi:MAG: N-acetyltransferase [Ferruginibacter sp.]|jgi:predicted GNAT family acetyltransferase|uniref:GNAT family N-acetyltransferase n=1 Tax=Ferruginibacter sp. TaxID=1940288 RepID=UPI002659A939|nr:GNAT family N-acetyltransferase [Ferruginibacter sp.]MDB5276199.1 N-acetyltransferase [Ferruginibacter sp.]
MSNEIKIINNEKRLHFETLLSNGEFAFIEYRWHNGNLVLMHTLVPEGFEGKGIAAALARFALEYAKEKQFKIVVYCPYVNAYLKKHAEYQFLVTKNEVQ